MKLQGGLNTLICLHGECYFIFVYDLFNRDNSCFKWSWVICRGKFSFSVVHRFTVLPFAQFVARKLHFEFSKITVAVVCVVQLIWKGKFCAGLAVSNYLKGQIFCWLCTVCLIWEDKWYKYFAGHALCAWYGRISGINILLAMHCVLDMGG